MKLIIVSMALLAMASATETNQELDQERLFIPVSFFNDNFGILDSMQRGTAFGVLALALVGMVILSASVFLTGASIKRRSEIQKKGIEAEKIDLQNNAIKKPLNLKVGQHIIGSGGTRWAETH